MNPIHKSQTQTNTHDLVIAWELSTQKIMRLLDQTLELRLKMRNSVADGQFSDFLLIDSLTSNLEQFKAIQAI